ncbi:MAG TPA: hypothetical protein VFY18_08320, partial [Candidatus Limnocylindrales bacterium]|nr:hypothetical protein [Candidatus Limnocylindrales bacterium]
DAAEVIEAAVADALDDRFRTPDLIPPPGAGRDAGDDLTVVGGAAMAQAVVDRIEIDRTASAFAPVSASS